MARAPYVFDRPMPVDKIVPGSFVYVPVWTLGNVTGWDNATVLHAWSSEEPSWIVRFPDGTEAGYFPYSVGCGMCMGRDDVTCHQCGTRTDGTPRE